MKDLENNKLMQEAIQEALNGVNSNHGGPFGAVIVDKYGAIVSRAHNEVVSSNDPTAHAEILAIRRASQKLGRFDLRGCTIYTTGEPCPMCLSAIYWARIDKVYYARSREDIAKIGFDDKFIYDVLERKKAPTVKVEKINFNDVDVFRVWEEKEDKIPY